MGYVGLSSSHARREYFMLYFMFKIINNLIDGAGVLDHVKFNVPHYLTRTETLFGIDNLCTELNKSSK